jgi:hypothetical protein
MMLLVFALVASLWTTTKLHGIDLFGGRHARHLCACCRRSDRLGRSARAERSAWDVSSGMRNAAVWPKRSARRASPNASPKRPRTSPAVGSGGRAFALALIYFYAHYAFASISAHALAMYLPFLLVIISGRRAGRPAALMLAYLSNLSASLTHYGTTSGPIYFGAGYVSQQTWWKLGFDHFDSEHPHLPTVGIVWWKIIGYW